MEGSLDLWRGKRVWEIVGENLNRREEGVEYKVVFDRGC